MYHKYYFTPREWIHCMNFLAVIDLNFYKYFTDVSYLVKECSFFLYANVKNSSKRLHIIVLKR